MQKEPINSSHLNFACPLKPSDLEQRDGETFCGKCQKEIFDLTDCSVDEVLAVHRTKGAICGIVRVLGAGSLLSVASCAGSGSTGDPLIDPTVIGTIPLSSLEEVEPPGGDDSQVR